MCDSHQYRFSRFAIRCTRIGVLLVGLLLLGSLAISDDGWRRTVSGWEHVSTWSAHVPSYNPPRMATSVHPLVVATLKLLVVAGLLVYLGDSHGNRNRR